MRLIAFMVLLAAILTSGCASQSVDCSMGVGRNGCAPGTKEYEEMRQEQRNANTTAEIDDARCQAYGARGTLGYLDCRRRAAEEEPPLKPSPNH